MESLTETLKAEVDAMVPRVEELANQTDAEHAFLSFALLQVMTVLKAGGITGPVAEERKLVAGLVGSWE